MKSSILILLVSTFLFQSCLRPEGEGGKTTLTGYIALKKYDQYGGYFVDSIAASDHRVYITYGNNDGFDDDTRTAPDGTYKFEFLNPGNYSIFTYSECFQCDGEEIVVIEEVNIQDKKDEVSIPTIVVNKYSQGNKNIYGKVIVEVRDKNTGTLIGTHFGHNERVFLSNSSTYGYDEDTRTNYDGTFKFNELNPGNYSVFAYSECISCPSGASEEVIKKDVSLLSNSESDTIPDITIIDYK